MHNICSILLRQIKIILQIYSTVSLVTVEIIKKDIMPPISSIKNSNIILHQSLEHI